MSSRKNHNIVPNINVENKTPIRYHIFCLRFFTKYGVWGFNPAYLTGLYIANLPLEEILFFISIPYACVFSYFAFQFLVKKNPLEKYQAIITNVLIGILVVVALFNISKLYTSITFFSTAIFLISHI